MAELTAHRTLLKSPPELWAEVSEVESLAKHLGELGEIRITRIESETTVAWEGEQISGTVALEQAGWGTKVTLQATVQDPEPVAEVEPIVEAEPAPTAEPAPPPEPEPTPDPVVEAEPDPEPDTVIQAEPVAVKRTGFLARWLFRERGPAQEPAREPLAETPMPEPVINPEPDPEPEPLITPPAEPDPQPEPEPEPVLEAEPVAEEPAADEPVAAAIGVERVQQVLDGTLDALGQAHHRPFSRG